MKKATFLLALFVFFNLLSFTSCTTDTEEDQLSVITQEVYADGEEYSPPDDNKGGGQ